MLQLKPEEKMILFLCRPGISEDDVKLFHELLMKKQNEIDYQKLFYLSIFNGVAPLLYRTVKDIAFLPIDFVNKLKNNYIMTDLRNRFQLEEVFNVLNLLNNNGIDAIVLKGVCASILLFEDIGIYPSGDIDLLIKPSNLSRADRLLLSDHYSKFDTICDQDLLKNHYHLIYCKNEQFFEIHWKLSKRYFPIPDHFWWDEAVALKIEGVTVKSLALEKYILYSIFRLFDHKFRPLKFFVFTAALISKHAHTIDWQKLFDYSKAFGMERLLVFVLRFLKEYFGIDLPDRFVHKGKTQYMILQRLVMAGIFRENHRPQFSMLIYMFLLIPNKNIIQILFKRLFPHSGEIRLRYGLPFKSKKIYLYYLLNPIFVFMHKKKK